MIKKLHPGNIISNEAGIYLVSEAGSRDGQVFLLASNLETGERLHKPLPADELIKEVADFTLVAKNFSAYKASLIPVVEREFNVICIEEHTYEVKVPAKNLSEAISKIKKDPNKFIPKGYVGEPVENSFAIDDDATKKANK